MNPLLRHLALRLWLTALVGGLASLALLPWWQHFMGIEWLVLPCLVLLTASFMVLGWGLNRMGIHLAARHLREAEAWNRAGMSIEAQAAFRSGAAIFDSFWLSPLTRRKKASWFQRARARFYLGFDSATTHARSVVAAYLNLNPGDADVAQEWLEQLPIYPAHLEAEHEAAARVGRALEEHPEIQQRLMHFYLSVRRFDFDARLTCQRVWQSGHYPSDDLVRKLCRMLLEGTLLSSWALQVYLKAHDAGEERALEGVAAAVRFLPPTDENRDALAAAKSVVAEMDPERLNDLARRFAPFAAAIKPRPRWRPPAWSRQAVSGPWLSRLAVAAPLVVLLTISVWYLSRPGPDPPPEVVMEVEEPVVIDPFTIQVAAFTRAGDAKRFVDQLIIKGLDAFWTKASSTNRTWYQVKVSHFASKAQARSYGNELKSRGLIDDFYVANYEPHSGDERQ